MKNTILGKVYIHSLLLVTSIAFLGCGALDQIKDQNKDKNPPPNPGSISTDDPNNPILQECKLKTLNDEIPNNCSSISFDSKTISSAAKADTEVSMVASIKNGGEGGSKWFNATILLSESINMKIPAEIPVMEGDCGTSSSQKLYVKFNDTIDCAWSANAKTRYRKPRCFYGATRKPSNSSGFTGGKEVDNTKINSVSAITMEVNGAAGDGLLTITNAKFSIITPSTED